MSEQWHYLRGGKQVGPVSAADLKLLASRGEFAPTDMVWRDGLPNWIPATNVEGVFAPPAAPDASSGSQFKTQNLPNWLAGAAPAPAPAAKPAPLPAAAAPKSATDSLPSWLAAAQPAVAAAPLVNTATQGAIREHESKPAVAMQCQACSKSNPPEANYCYYDGRPLSQAGFEGPIQIGTQPFPMPFCFSNGQGCANFNQLALACDERWDEARSLLADGVWPTFFAAIGRLDLVAAAKQAAKEPDPDVGLSQLLEKFPADPNALRLPKLGLPSAMENLGTLTPGTDHKFELRISNQGMLVLRGMITSDCEWLSFGEPAGGQSMKMFQTRNIFTLPVRVLGHKLRSGLKTLEGEIVIDTNGGVVTLPVRANVPVRPFPKGQYANDVLAGARTPHVLADMAKAHPKEAAVLFEQGAVKAWYASNGWTYPVQGTEGTGRGAVQQFFEALGLAKAPRLELTSGSIICEGRPGQRLTKQVKISTQESKPVYAHAVCNQAWIQAGPGKSSGHSVTIPLEIEVPQRAGETVHAVVTVMGNGNQKFAVPVTLAVMAGAVDEETDADAEANAGAIPDMESDGFPFRWLFAGIGLMLAFAVGVFVFVKSRQNDAVENPPVVAVDKPPPPVVTPAPKGNAWWDSIPETKLAALASALKQGAPQDQAIFDGIAAKSDIERNPEYEKLAAKVPELVRNPKTKDSLGPLLVDCYVFEPSDLNVAPLRRALASQLPKEGAEFRPEEKGEELAAAVWSLQAGFDAMNHKSIHADRAKGLANELGSVFGPVLDTRAPLKELKNQAEMLLAQRFYRSLLPTAVKSIDHAFAMRTMLLEKFPQQVSPLLREKVDVDLVTAGLAKGLDAWPKVEPILKSSLETNDVATTEKIVGMYAQAKPDLASKLEDVLAAKWKEAANPKLTHTEKVAAIRTKIESAANRAKVSPTERLAQLQKLTSSTLTAVKPKQKEETALLLDTVRLAHASTAACDLFQKEAGLQRFDELVTQIPDIDQADLNDAKDKAGNAKQPAANKGRIVTDRPKAILGTLTLKSDVDPIRAGSFSSDYLYFLKAGQPYTFNLTSRAFNAHLRMEQPKGNVIAEANDRGVGQVARFSFTPATDGDYVVVVTTLFPGRVGAYALLVQKGIAFGAAKGPPQPGTPVQAAPKTDEKKEKQFNLSDLDDLDSKQTTVRTAAFNRLADTVANDLAPQHAQRIAKYLIATVELKSELDDVSSKLDSFSKCRHVLLALSDYADKEKATQKTTEAIASGVLGQKLRFAADENWRAECRMRLIQRALDLTGSTRVGADQAADILRDFYKEQGLNFGIEDPDFLGLTQPTQVLESVIKHVAAKAAKLKIPTEDKEFLEHIDRQLQVAEFLADNDLDHMVRLQRTWIKVLSLYLTEQTPAQVKRMVQIQRDLDDLDDRTSSVLDQLRAGEEKILRIWALAHNLK